LEWHENVEKAFTDFVGVGLYTITHFTVEKPAKATDVKWLFKKEEGIFWDYESTTPDL
jgi:hypothetical protein